MNKQAVLDIVKNILIYHGYSISSSEICDLLAEKGSEHLLIKFENDPNINNVRYFSNVVQRYGKGVLISESFDEKIRMIALDEGLSLWDRGELESRIGRAVLARTLVEHGEREPIKEKSEMQAHQPERADREKVLKVLLHSVPINIGKSDALSIAEAKLGSVKSQTLKFIPIWYYSYSFNVQKKYKSKLVDLSGEGEGYIDALIGDNFFKKFRDIQENALSPTQNYEILEPVISQKDAVAKALNFIIREHTKEVRLNEMIGDTIIFENRIFAPDQSEINLKMDLLHIPVWEIKGKREAININGYDGYIISIKLYNDADMV